MLSTMIIILDPTIHGNKLTEKNKNKTTFMAFDCSRLYL